MVVICPTITAFEPHEFREQIELAAKLSSRVHIDLMDGQLAPSKSPKLEQVWWPHEVLADIHLMYQRPMEQLDLLVTLKPNMVIIHAEAEADHMLFAAELHKHDIKTGLAVLQDTPIQQVEQIMHSFDQVLIFSGNLGYHGGQADLGLLDKVEFVRTHHPEAEIAWDGGISDKNIRALTEADVNVLNVGGYIQKSPDPKKAYDTLLALA